jgi:hypothetical protein
VQRQGYHWVQDTERRQTKQKHRKTTQKTKKLGALLSIMVTFITDVITTHNFTGDINFVGRSMIRSL